MRKNAVSYPHINNRNRAAMFVANHNSWMDIPFVGTTVGFRNYKMVSKAELAKVPILGRSIKVGGHVMVDRSNRKSQLLTLKAGMQWLKVSHDCNEHLRRFHFKVETQRINICSLGWSPSCYIP